MTSPTPPSCGVIVLGDHDTGRWPDVLAEKATEHGATVTEIRTFEPGEVGAHDDLAEVGAVVTALSRAICTKTDIWVPFPMPDLGREQHVRRLSLVLQRHGRNLLLGPGLWPCPTAGGMNEADFALRREVQAVDDLDSAALAAVGFHTLGKEIELALADTSSAESIESPAEQFSEVPDQSEPDCDPRPVLPAATAGWSERQPALKRYATWLVDCCGLTQTDAARVLNASGHRTPQGKVWQQGTVSALINGRYDRRAAA
jgi:hypothetical protein